MDYRKTAVPPGQEICATTWVLQGTRGAVTMSTVRFTAYPQPHAGLVVDAQGYALVGDWLMVHGQRKRQGTEHEPHCPYIGWCWHRDFGMFRAQELAETWMRSSYDDKVMWSALERLYVEHLGRLV